jgi:hypothetical protein
MNAKNVRSVTNVNKYFLITALAMLPLPLWAQDVMSTTTTVALPTADTPSVKKEQPPAQQVYTAPALYEIKEVFIDYPIMIDPKISSDCGLTRESMLTALQRNLQDPGLDVMALNDTHPRVGARVNLTVEVATIKQGKTCTSWIEMPFTDKAPIMLPPVRVPRSLTLVFWQQKKIVDSSDERHQAAVNDMLSSMVRQFLRDVKLAVPNALLEEKHNTTSEESEKNEKNEARMKSLNDSVAQKLIVDQQAPEIPVTQGHDKKP